MLPSKGKIKHWHFMSRNRINLTDTVLSLRSTKVKEYRYKEFLLCDCVYTELRIRRIGVW